jgi:hypothetical protein
MAVEARFRGKGLGGLESKFHAKYAQLAQIARHRVLLSAGGKS